MIKKDIPSVERLLKNKLRGFEEFHKMTKTITHPKRNQDPASWPKEWKTIYYKEYPRLEKIILPKPHKKRIMLHGALLSRRSVKKYSLLPTTLEVISNLLFFSAGIRNKADRFRYDRYFPSGGARYPLEIYIISLNTELEKGVYHYNVRSHSLELLTTSVKLLKGSLQSEWMYKASLLIVLTAVFERSVMKYMERGYRYILLEAGHIAQNFYLNAEAEDIGISGVGGYIDDQINQLLDIDGLSESVVYILAAGNK